LLKAFGYDTKINIITDKDKTYNTYALMGNITEFDFFMVILKGSKLSELDICILLWRAGVNPKVYNPFLSYDILDKSLKLMNDKNYQITLAQ
jgi:hypothetical protein